MARVRKTVGVKFRADRVDYRQLRAALLVYNQNATPALWETAGHYNGVRGRSNQHSAKRLAAVFAEADRHRE
jgi:hypothetical protein